MAVNPLLVRFAPLFLEGPLCGPVLDLACGTGENGLYLARLGVPVVLADKSASALAVARSSAAKSGLEVELWQVDLESGDNPLPADHYRGVIVFHYLHRPLIRPLREAVRDNGLVIYETFTTRQPKYGRPHNPHYLLKPGELASWFSDWEVLHYYEGLLKSPTRAVAQIVCRKPVGPRQPQAGPSEVDKVE